MVGIADVVDAHVAKALYYQGNLYMSECGICGWWTGWQESVVLRNDVSERHNVAEHSGV